MMAVGVSPAVAQLRLIPQSRIDSVRQSHTVANAPIALSDEGRLQMGRIAEEGGVWQGRVVWTNHADRPLVITRVASTCGCLKGHYEARPVAKGECQTITLSYTPIKPLTAAFSGTYTGSMLMQHVAGYVPEDIAVETPESSLSEVSATWYSRRTPREYMNTVQPEVFAMMMELLGDISCGRI